jgi:methylated-DNA-[protein]-cysteine S-methyltransferase
MSYSLFATPFGTCGIAWNEAALTGFQLPDTTPELTAHHLAARGGGPAAAPPVWVQAIIVRVQHHLAGQLQDFEGTPIDWLRVSEFQAGVYRQTLAIKAGATRTYGDIARRLGLGADSARAVGAALGSNPWPLIVPCHRVVSAGDRMTGFSAPGGVRTKTRLLALEGAELLSE